MRPSKSLLTLRNKADIGKISLHYSEGRKRARGIHVAKIEIRLTRSWGQVNRESAARNFRVNVAVHRAFSGHLKKLMPPWEGTALPPK